MNVDVKIGTASPHPVESTLVPTLSRGFATEGGGVRLNSVDDIPRAASLVPGTHIEGFGDLPLVAPPQEPHLAYRPNEGVPSAEVTARAIELHNRFRSSNYLTHELEHFGAHLIDERADGKNTLTDEQILQLVEFKKYRLLQEVAFNYPDILNRWQQFSDQKKKFAKEMYEGLLKKAQDDSITSVTDADRQWIVDIYPEGTEVEKQIAENRAKRHEERVKSIEKQFNEENRDRMMMRYDDQDEFERWTINSNIPNPREYPITISGNSLILSALNELDRNLSHFTLDGTEYQLRTMIEQHGMEKARERAKQLVISRIPSLGHYSEFTAQLAEQLLTYSIGNDDDSFQRNWDTYCEQTVRSGKVPQGYVNSYASESLPAFSARDYIPNSSVEYFQDELLSEGAWYKDVTFGAYIELLKLNGEQLPDTNQLLESWEYVQKHRIEPRAGTFVGGFGFEVGRLGSEALNTQIVDPSLPSVKILEELRRRGNLHEVETDPQYAKEWAMVSRLLAVHHIDSQEWWNWAKMTKRAGLGAMARRVRNHHIQDLIQMEKFNPNVSIEDDLAMASELRFPSYQEIMNEMVRRAQAPVRRNSGYRAWQYLTVPVRVDREQELGKYHLADYELPILYREAYRVLSRDFGQDGSPESYAAYFRSSLMAVIGGGHEQYYKGWKDFSHGSVAFDELDLLMFLPEIARDNGNDPGFLLLGYRALLQMDQHLKEQYAPEIHDVFRTLIRESDALHDVEDYLGDPDYVPPLTQLSFNVSHRSERIHGFDEMAIEQYKGSPDTNTYLGKRNAKGFYRREKDGTKRLIHVFKEEDYERVKNLKTGDVPALFGYGDDVYYSDVPLSDVMVLGLDPRTVHTEEQLKRPWRDPDIEWDPATDALVAKADVLKGVNSAMERIRRKSPDAARLVEKLVVEDENTTLTPLTSTAELLEILSGRERFDPSDISEMLRLGDKALQLAARLRGATREEAAEIFKELHEPVSLADLTLDGFANQIWGMSGGLEREAIATYVLMVTTAGYRLSIQRIFDKVEEHQRMLYANELMSVSDVSAAYAKVVAEKAVKWSFYDSRDELQKDIEKLNRAVEGVDPVSSDELSLMKRKFRTKMAKLGADCVNELASVTNYNFASTHFLQIMDQLFATEVNGKQYDFLDTEGKVNLYCVQSSYLLYEMLRDLYNPVEAASWHKPMEFHIALEDEKYGISLVEYYERIAGEDNTDSYNHFLVLTALPQLQEGDKRYYILFDQTESTARIFSEVAVKSQTSGDIIIDNAKANLSQTDKTLKRMRDKGTTRLVMAPNIADQSGNMISQIMQGVEGLRNYSRELGCNFPRTYFDIACDAGTGVVQRVEAIRTLMQRYPYFTGQYEFYKPAEYVSRMWSIMDLCNKQELPVVGLFAAKTLRAIDKNDSQQIDKQIQLIKKSCYYLPQDAWESQRTVYAHLLLPRDLAEIELVRRDIKQKAEAEKERLRKQAQEDADRKIRKGQQRLSSRLRTEQIEVAAMFSSTRVEAGSKPRLADTLDAISTTSNVVQEMFSAQENIPLLEEQFEEKKVALTLSGGSRVEEQVRMAPPYKITPDAAQMHAAFVLSGVDVTNPEALSAALEFIGAGYRGLVHEGYRNDSYRKYAWGTVNDAISKTLSGRGVTLKQPLGELDELLARPATEMREILAQQFGYQVPRIGRSARLETPVMIGSPKNSP